MRAAPAPAAARRPRPSAPARRPRRPLKRIRLTVAPSEASTTLEALLCGRGGLAPDRVREVLARGGVTVNRRRVERGDHALGPRDEVVAHLEERGRAGTGVRALDASRVLFEDADVVAIDKPPGLAAQGTALDAAAGLDAAVRALLAARGVSNPFVGLVHRLDLETSGVTLFGRTPAAVTALSEEFREGRVEKRYVALVAGTPAWDERTVDEPIDADRAHPGTFVVSPRGRPACTVLRVEERGQGRSLAWARVEARPRTGRTHQIRVHAARVGHPLLGDRRYGGPAFLTAEDGVRITPPRVALHAAELVCAHPRGGELRVRAPFPADLAALEAELRRVAHATPGGSAAARRR